MFRSFTWEIKQNLDSMAINPASVPPEKGDWDQDGSSSTNKFPFQENAQFVPFLEWKEITCDDGIFFALYIITIES